MPGSRKGIKNKRTLIREQRMAQIAEASKAVADGTVDISTAHKDGVAIMEEAMLYFYVLAERERRLGGAGDSNQVRIDLKIAAEIAKDVAPYHRPKQSSVRIGGDPDLPPIQLETLTDAQLDLLIDRLLQGLADKGSGSTTGGT